MANRFHVGITEEKLKTLQTEAKMSRVAQTTGVPMYEVTQEQAEEIPLEDGWTMAPPVGVVQEETTFCSAFSSSGAPAAWFTCI